MNLSIIMVIFATSALPALRNRLDALDRDAPTRNPDQQLAADGFGAVVDPDRPGLATPLDDPIKASDHTLGWQPEADLDSQALAIEAVDHIQQTKLADIAEPVSHEVH